MTKKDMTKKDMFHYLRNPFGADETITRAARLQAADELERLYGIEERINEYFDNLSEKILKD